MASNIDLDKLVKFHNQHGKLASVSAVKTYYKNVKNFEKNFI